MLLPSLVAMILVACGDNAPESAVARLEVSPAAVTLTSANDTRRLDVVAFDTDGNRVPVRNVTWTSSRPEQIAVAADGTVTAVTSLGGSQLVARVGDVSSTPVLATAIEVAPGVILIDDDAVVEPPRELPGTLPEDLDAPYEVVLRGAPPAPGSLLLGTGGISIGGEVVSAIAEGETSRVQLQLVELPRLVAGALVSESVDAGAIPPEINPEIERLYDITVVDGAHVFTPKPGASFKPSLHAPIGPVLAANQIGLGPIATCETDLPQLPFTLGALPQVSVKVEPTYDVTYDTAGNLKRMVVKAEPVFQATINLLVNVDATIAVECKSPLYSRVAKFPGWVGLLLAGEVEAGLGFEIESKLTVLQAGVILQSTTTSKIELGVTCAADNCDLVNKVESKNETKPTWVVPNLGQLRFEPQLFGFGYVALKLGATALKTARIETVTAQLGGKYEASLAPVGVQTAPTAPGLPDYRSSYGLSLLAKVFAGKKLEGILKKLGLTKFNPLELSLSIPLAGSPKGSATFDRNDFAFGDPVKFKVQLDPQSVSIPGFGYNVKRVKIVHRRAGAIEIASVDAAPDQTTFDLTWQADIAAGAAGSTFFAFVETVLPSIVDLELAKATFEPPGVACVPAPGKQYCASLVTMAGDLVKGLNNRGDVLFEPFASPQSRIITAGGTVVALPEFFNGFDLNNNLEVAGTDAIPDGTGTFANLPALFANGSVTRLSTQRMGTDPDINARGELTFSEDTVVRGSFVVRKDAAGQLSPPEPLLFPGFEQSVHAKINDGGDVVFMAFPASGPGGQLTGGHLIQLFDGAMTDLAASHFPLYLANDRTILVTSAPGPTFATIKDGVLTPLASGAFTNVRATSMNNRKEIIGFADAELLYWSSPIAQPVAIRSLIDGTIATTQPAFFTQLQINDAGTIVYQAFQFSDGTFLIRPASGSNLAVSMIVPPVLAPGAGATYAVNLQNSGPGAASELRAEFVLPDGFVLTGTTGWDRCEIALSIVTCEASSIAAGEQRAFLIDVLAPQRVGSYTVAARVSSLTTDIDLSNNEAISTTSIVEP